MQIFYTDISKLFECDIQIIGAPLSDATARVIFDIGGKEFSFNGSINSIGHCVFNIPALGSYNVLGPGNLTLEVIVDNVLFKPFTDTINVQDSTGSDFLSFIQTTNYDSVDNIDSNYTFLTKKVYNEAPYMVLPGLKFNIKVGDTKPDLKFFVFKLGEQFGDPIPLPGLAGYTITIKVYDYNYNMVCYGPATFYDQVSGQITYSFSALDFTVSGVYYFEVSFVDDNNLSFTLPESNIKYEIIVRE